MTILTTERLTLRRARSTDLDALHAIMADAETMRYWSTPAHSHVEVTEAFLDGMINPVSGTSDEFIIEFQGRLIGKLGMWRIPEIGFILARERWGCGYAGEALGAFMTYAFASTTDHLTAEVDPCNRASLTLQTRFGFVETGARREPGASAVNGATAFIWGAIALDASELTDQFADRALQSGTRNIVVGGRDRHGFGVSLLPLDQLGRTIRLLAEDIAVLRVQVMAFVADRSMHVLIFEALPALEPKRR